MEFNWEMDYLIGVQQTYFLWMMIFGSLASVEFSFMEALQGCTRSVVFYTELPSETCGTQNPLCRIYAQVLSKTQAPSIPEEVKRMKDIPYASAIGSIMYAMRCTRPDVSFALNMTSGYQQNPGESLWTVVKNILKYLRNTEDMFLVYGGFDELSVKCYTDASFERDRDDIRSQSGYVFVMNGGAVDWRSSK